MCRCCYDYGNHTESSEKDMWWVNELEFRGVTVETLNELNNVRETCCLVEKIANIL